MIPVRQFLTSVALEREFRRRVNRNERVFVAEGEGDDSGSDSVASGVTRSAENVGEDFCCELFIKSALIQSRDAGDLLERLRDAQTRIPSYSSSLDRERAGFA